MYLLEKQYSMHNAPQCVSSVQKGTSLALKRMVDYLWYNGRAYELLRRRTELELLLQREAHVQIK